MSRFWAKYLDFWVNSWFSVMCWIMFLIDYIVYILHVYILNIWVYIKQQVGLSYLTFFSLWLLSVHSEAATSIHLECRSIFWSVRNRIMERGALHSSAFALREILMFSSCLNNQRNPCINLQWLKLYLLVENQLLSQKSSHMVLGRILFWLYHVFQRTATLLIFELSILCYSI